MALTNITAYQDFIEAKSQSDLSSGFEPVFMPDYMFDFQAALTAWNCIQGRSADFADCGLGNPLRWPRRAQRLSRGWPLGLKRRG